MGNVEHNRRLGIDAELNEFLPHLGIVQVGKTLVARLLGRNAWFIIELVIGAKIVLLKNLVHQFATVATEGLAVEGECCFTAFVAAMVTQDPGVGQCFFHSNNRP